MSNEQTDNGSAVGGSPSNGGLERLPMPDCTYADHSYPAYSAKAMRDAILAEREACAILAGQETNKCRTWPDAQRIVDAIRKRSNVEVSGRPHLDTIKDK